MQVQVAYAREAVPVGVTRGVEETNNTPGKVLPTLYTLPTLVI